MVLEVREAGMAIPIGRPLKTGREGHSRVGLEAGQALKTKKQIIRGLSGGRVSRDTMSHAKRVG